MGDVTIFFFLLFKNKNKKEKAHGHTQIKHKLINMIISSIILYKIIDIPFLKKGKGKFGTMSSSSSEIYNQIVLEARKWH